MSKPILARVRLNYTYSGGDSNETDILVECAARPPGCPAVGDIRAICNAAKVELIERCGKDIPTQIEAHYLGTE